MSFSFEQDLSFATTTKSKFMFKKSHRCKVGGGKPRDF